MRALRLGSALSMLMLLTATAYAQSSAAELRAVRTITVNGLAKKKVVPDEAHVNVNLNALDLQMALAKKAHDEKLQKLMNIVSEYHIDKQKVSTQSSNVQPVYTYENNPKTGVNGQVFKGYRMQTVVDIKVEDAANLARLMDSIAKAGFDKSAPPEWGTLLNLFYALSDPDKLHEELLVKAIANAKTKADKMAAAAHAKTARVLQINEGAGFSYQPQPMPMMLAQGFADAAMAKNAAVAPPAGEQEVQTNVTVTYELE